MEKWFAILERVFQLATHCNIKLHIEKCDMFTTQVKYCRRVFSTEGVSHDPARIDALISIPQTKTAIDFQQFLMVAHWMSRSIPEFNTKVYLLHQIFFKEL